MDVCVRKLGIAAWVIVPIVSLISKPPVEDDVAKFIVSSGWHPLLVLAAVCLIIIMLTLLLSNGVIQSFIIIAKQVNQLDSKC